MIYDDAPIQKCSEDKLNRKSFAEHLADLLEKQEIPNGMCIGLNGVWGSGKTSLLNMTEEILHNNSQVLVAWFHPWNYISMKQLYGQFFCLLADTINQKKFKEFNNVSESLLKFGEQLTESLSGDSVFLINMAVKGAKKVVENLNPWSSENLELQRKK